MVQIANGSDRQVWASHIGRIIFSLNEIDWLFELIYTKVLKEELASSWHKKTFSEHIDIIREKIERKPGSPAMDELKKLVARTLPLNETRNHVAHGTLALVGAPDDAPRGASFEMLRYHKKSDEMRTVTFEFLVEQTACVIQLSDDYSQFLAMCELHAGFIAPYD